MQLNMFSTTAKRVTKMTSKAKAALEEKAGSSKKQKPESDGSGDNATSLHLKKAKTHQATGITQSSSITAAAKKDLPISPPSPAVVPVPTVVSTRHAASVVPPEEEEDIIDVDSDDKSKESESDAEHERNNESAEDQLSTLMNALYN